MASLACCVCVLRVCVDVDLSFSAPFLDHLLFGEGYFRDYSALYQYRRR